MSNCKKLFYILKKLLLWPTKILYMSTTVLSVMILLFEDYGRDKVGAMVLFLTLAFLSWLTHIWIRNTRYIGFVGALIVYCLLWIYTPLLHLFFAFIANSFNYLQKIKI